jgi:hypothetical protein
VYIVRVVADVAEAGDRGVGHHMGVRAEDMERRQAAAERYIAASTQDGGFVPDRRMAAYNGRSRWGGGQCVAAGHGGLARGGRGGGRCFATSDGGRAGRSS